MVGKASSRRKEHCLEARAVFSPGPMLNLSIAVSYIFFAMFVFDTSFCILLNFSYYNAQFSPIGIGAKPYKLLD